VSVVRILFLGTADFAVPALEACAKDEHFKVTCVISQPDKPAGRKMQLTASPVKETALKLGLEVFTPENINTPESLEKIKALRCEAAVVVAYGQILSQEFLDLFPKGAVNLHGSILPRWRGAAPIQRALMAGDPESGVTLQKVAFKLDSGDVLGTRRVILTDDVDAEVLYTRLKNFGADLVHIEFMDYIRGNLSGLKQDDSQVTIAKKIKKEEGLIDWSRTAREIFNQYRALKLWPGVWTMHQGKTLKIHQMKYIFGQSGTPGKILSSDKDSLLVACGKDAVQVFEVQPESKARQKVADFLNGLREPLKNF
jgi:methionyl-tRNA formyltransferase